MGQLSNTIGFWSKNYQTPLNFEVRIVKHHWILKYLIFKETQMPKSRTMALQDSPGRPSEQVSSQKLWLVNFQHRSEELVSSGFARIASGLPSGFWLPGFQMTSYGFILQLIEQTTLLWVHLCLGGSYVNSCAHRKNRRCREKMLLHFCWTAPDWFPETRSQQPPAQIVKNKFRINLKLAKLKFPVKNWAERGHHISPTGMPSHEFSASLAQRGDQLRLQWSESWRVPQTTDCQDFFAQRCPYTWFTPFSMLKPLWIIW